MDETCIYFELTQGQTLEVKGKKIVGGFSSGKSKESLILIITVSSDGYLLPPFAIFKKSKPRTKTFSDHPPQEKTNFKGQNIKQMIEREDLVAVNTYSR